MKPVSVTALMLIASLAGCTDNGIGRKCIEPVADLGLSPGNHTLLSSPALECPTRLCLIETTQDFVDRSVCTGQCLTDTDCQQATIGNASDGLCPSSFVCAVATVQGAFQCKKVCVCRDDLVCGLNSDASGNVITPAACPNPSPKPNCPITVQPHLP
jgi:hypothetical protein